MNSGFSSPPFPGSPERLAVRTNFMPDWIGDQMAGVRPDATRVFGRNRKERPFAEGLFQNGLPGPLTEGGRPGL
jgi:hypothetical protein